MYQKTWENSSLSRFYFCVRYTVVSVYFLSRSSSNPLSNSSRKGGISTYALTMFFDSCFH
eukprot:UN16867